MTIYQARDDKKPTGGKRRSPYKVKRKALRGRFFTETRLATEESVEKQRVRGGNMKLRVKKANKATVTDPDTKETKTMKIIRIIETPANKEYARRGIIVKGTVIEVEAGKAIVTSRPGQHGTINAILLKE